LRLSRALAVRPALPLQHWLAVSLCTGLAVANLVRIGSVVAGAVALAALVVLVVSGRARLRFAALCTLFLLAGLALATLRLAALERSQLTSYAGQAAPARVVVTGPPRASSFAVSAPAEVESFFHRPLGERVWLELPAGRQPKIGAILDVVASVQLPRPMSASGFDQRAWLAHQGIHVVLKASLWHQAGRRGGLYGLVDRFRERLVRDVAPGLKGERRGLVLGFVLGEDEGLSPALRQDFRRSGLYHLLAVSGQNVAFLVAGVLGLAWLCGIPRRYGEIAALAAICAYVLVVGWQPSVVRAAVAGVLASLAWLAARPRDRWYFLLLGAIVLLVWNPQVIYDAGFQLSFAAVAAIFLAAKPLERRLQGYPLPPPLRPVIAVSAVCSLATAPIMLLEFGKVPVYGVLANALVEPVVALVLLVGLACALIAPLVAPAAQALAFINGLLVSYIGLCARAVAALPGAQVMSARLLELLPYAVLLALTPFLRRPRLPRLLVLATLVFVSLWFWNGRPRPVPGPPRGLRVTFLDVGQGDSTLLQTKSGAVLVDAGPPEANVASQLRRLGVRRLQALFLTHPQRDHVGGAADVLAKLDVGEVLDPGIPSTDSYELAARDEAHAKRVPIRLARAGQQFALGALRLRILWPQGDPPAESDSNESAIVTLASFGATDFLLPSDAESSVTLPLGLGPIEVLKVAHHGSSDDGLPELLARLHPQVAAISVGLNNDYGHPTPSTLAALAASPGLRTYRTDLQGQIVVETDGHDLVVKPTR